MIPQDHIKNLTTIYQSHKYLSIQFQPIHSTNISDIITIHMEYISRDDIESIQKTCHKLRNFKMVYYSSHIFEILTNVEQMVNLETLQINVGSNVLFIKDGLRKIKRLRYLSLSTDLKIEENVFIRIVESQPNLQGFKLFNCDRDIVGIHHLKNLKKLISLRFYMVRKINQILNQVCQNFGDIIEAQFYGYKLNDKQNQLISTSFKKLQNLYLGYTFITHKGLQFILKGLKNLKKFGLIYMLLQKKSAGIILQNLSYLEQLDLKHITFKQTASIINFFSPQNPHLLLLNLQNYQIDNTQIKTLCQFQPKLKQLKLSCNKIYNSTIQIICSFLTYLQSLSFKRFFYDDQTQVTNSGCFYLSKLKNLQKLKLPFKIIDTSGCERLVIPLRKLYEIDMISYNKITQKLIQKSTRNTKISRKLRMII